MSLYGTTETLSMFAINVCFERIGGSLMSAFIVQWFLSLIKADCNEEELVKNEFRGREQYKRIFPQSGPQLALLHAP